MTSLVIIYSLRLWILWVIHVRMYFILEIIFPFTLWSITIFYTHVFFLSLNIYTIYNSVRISFNSFITYHIFCSMRSLQDHCFFINVKSWRGGVISVCDQLLVKCQKTMDNLLLLVCQRCLSVSVVFLLWLVVCYTFIYIFYVCVVCL